MENIKTYLPLFCGFYESLEDSILEQAFEREIEYLRENGVAEEVLENAWKRIDWRGLMVLTSQIAVDVVNARIEKACEVESPCKFENLWSPKYYNYCTDEIQIALHGEAFRALRQKFPQVSGENEAEHAANLIKASFDEDALSDARETFLWDLQEASDEQISGRIAEMLSDLYPVAA